MSDMVHVSVAVREFMAELVKRVEWGGHGFVYFAQRGDSGPIKIGCSVDPWKRLRSLQTGCPEPLRIIGYLRRGKKSRATEQWWHLMMRAFRIAGEWFHPDTNLLSEMRSAVDADRAWWGADA